MIIRLNKKTLACLRNTLKHKCEPSIPSTIMGYKWEIDNDIADGQVRFENDITRHIENIIKQEIEWAKL